MDTFAPEFSKIWPPDTSRSRGDSVAAHRDEEMGTQQAALDELAERVTAARSVL